jgi:hypothetical protein
MSYKEKFRKKRKEVASSFLLQAFDKIEVLENAAKMSLIVELTKKKSPLSKSRILEIEKIFR